MNIGVTIKKIAPAFIYYAYRNVFERKHYWEGVYDNFKNVPVSGLGFDSRTWVESAKRAVKELVNGSTDFWSSGIHHKTAPPNDLLAILVSQLCLTKPSITILDFGGGLGTSYLHLINTTPANLPIKYIIIENKLICEEGQRLYSRDPRIQFYDNFHEDIQAVDLIFINSALQYIEDYSIALKKLISYKPKFFLLANFSAGDIPTYATAQRNVRGSKIPYWFLNIDEVIKIFSESNYSLVFRSKSSRKYDQSNFPIEYQLNYACNLLFYSDSKS